MLHRQPPAHSPLSFRALVAGLRVAATGDREPTEMVRRELERRYDASFVALTDSGTSALALALREAARRGGGDPVALPAYGCFDLATAADAAGVDVVLYDLEPETLSPDMASLERAVGDGASAIVAVPLYGVPLSCMEEMRAWCRELGASFIEDAAQAMGALWKDRPLGSHGDLSVLSFGRGKGWTGGGGGALLARDSEHERLVRARGERLRPGSRGWGEVLAATMQWMLGRPGVYGLPASLPFLGLGETVYHAPHPPAGMALASAQLLASTRRLARDETRTRRENARRLRSAVRSARGISVIEEPSDGRPGWLRLPVLADSARLAKTLVQGKGERLGLAPGYPHPLAGLGGFRDRCRNGHRDFSGARSASERIVTVPTHGLLREVDLEQIEERLRRC